MSLSATPNLAIAAEIGTRVRQFRTERALTLEALAASANIGRRTLVNIEHGQANASIAVLLRIAAALGISLSTLIETVDTTPLLVRRRAEHTQLWTGESGGAGSLVGAVDGAQAVEVWDWTMHPGESHSSEPHTRGSREIAYVLAGTLELHVGAASCVLNTGDAAVMFGDQAHTYRCAGDEPVRFNLTVTEPHIGAPK